MKLSKTTRTWIHGLSAAAVSGVGTALSGVAAGIDIGKLKVMLLIQALLSVGLYLKQSPLPPEEIKPPDIAKQP